MIADLVVSQRLDAADLRMLACREDPDPRLAGCLKARVSVNGTTAFLCSLRVEAFLSPDSDGRSLASLMCELWSS